MSDYLKLFFVGFLFCTLLVSGVFSYAGEKSESGITLVSTSSDKAAEISDFTGVYVLGAGDRMMIVVYGESDLSAEYSVDGEGYISFPLIGNVKVLGLSAPKVQDLIKKKLSDGYIRNPSVSIQVSQHRPFYILGEVKIPGSYHYVSNMSILNAVALAGGFTYRANKSEVELVRGGQGPGSSLDDVDVEEEVKPGDIILVKERFF